MSHEIYVNESGQAHAAYAAQRGLPWHKLGTLVPEGMTDSASVIKAANMDREIYKKQLYYPAILAAGSPPRMTAVTNAFVTCDDLGRQFGVVGKDYQVLAPRDAFTILDGWAQDDRTQYEAAMELYGGKRFAILARMGETFLVAGKDPIVPYVLFTSSHDGTMGVTIMLTPTRVVCANTLSAALSAKSATRVQIRHTRHMHSNLATANEALQVTSRRQAELFAAFDRMAQATPTEETVTKVIEALTPEPTADQGERAWGAHEAERLELWRLLNESPTVKLAGGKDTNWGVYNLATEWIDHLQPRRNADLDKATEKGESVLRKAVETRAMYSLEGFGSGFRQKAFDLLAV